MSISKGGYSKLRSVISRIVESRKQPYGQLRSWVFLTWYDIPNPEGTQTYLRRIRVFGCPRFSIFVHFLYLPDNDRHLHDHPWPFTSIILRGGYEEEVAPVALYRKYSVKEVPVTFYEHYWGLWSRHHMPLMAAHRINRLDPGTVSLVIAGRRTQKWGFYTEEGWIPWDQYDRLGNGPDPYEGPCTDTLNSK